MKNRKNIWIAAAIALLLLVVLTGAAYYRNAGEGGGEPGIFDTVATVNGEAIAYGELLQDLNAQKSSIFTYFRNKYGVEDHANFWTTAYGGEVPADKLKKQALDSSVRKKIQQSIGKKLGIINDIGYRTLLDDMKKENERRQEVVKNKGVIYGPITYAEPLYADERLRNLIAEIKDKMNGDFQLTDQDYEDYYASHKDALYKWDDLTTVKAILVPLSGVEEEKERGAASTKLDAIKKRIDQGESFDAIYDELAGQKDTSATAVEKVLGDYPTKEAYNEGQTWLQSIGSLRPGQVSDIVEGADRIGMYKVVDVRSRGYRPLTDVKNGMRIALLDSKYEAFIDQSVQDAKVEVMEERMNRVKMR